MENEIILYHGTNVKFDEVDLKHSKDKRDFGRGFYTTTIKEQAFSWAENMFIRYGGEGKYVMKFRLKLEKELNTKIFCGLSKEWLTMIKDNRLLGGIQHDYDIVIGPVADDNTIRTVSLFVAGIYNEDIAIDRLTPYEPHDQVSLHTPKALLYLEFLGRV